MATVNRNPAGIANKKNQRKDSKAKPVSRIKRTVMEGTGSGNCRGQGIQMPKAMAMPREPASGTGSARNASLGQGMTRWTPVSGRRFLGPREVPTIQYRNLIAKGQWRTYAFELQSEE